MTKLDSLYSINYRNKTVIQKQIQNRYISYSEESESLSFNLLIDHFAHKLTLRVSQTPLFRLTQKAFLGSILSLSFFV